MCKGTFKYFDIKILLFPVLWRLRQEDGDVGANLGYTATLSFQKQPNKRTLEFPQVEEGLWAFVITHILFELSLCFQGRRMLGWGHIFDFNCSLTSMISINSLQTSLLNCHGHSHFCSWNILLLWIRQQGQERKVHKRFLIKKKTIELVSK